MKCIFCGKSQVGGRKITKYCSDYCREMHYTEKRKINKPKSRCLECGDEYDRKTTQNVFCSPVCQAKRRGRLKLSNPLIREYFLERANFMCEECENNNNESLCLHHNIPIYKGGHDTEDNIIVLCTSCHKKKHKIW